MDFKSSNIYKILSLQEKTYEIIFDLNQELNKNKDTILLEDKEIGTYLHYLTQIVQADDVISWRMVYSLSNAGINVNKKNSKGNTALHIACMRGYVEINNLFFEALFKIGIDPTIKNNNGNYASYYMEDIEQFKIIYKSHYPGILAAIDKQNVEEVRKFARAWIKLDFKWNNNMSLSSHNTKNVEILKILNEYKDCNSFIHALQAIDIDRMLKLLENGLRAKFNPNMADYSYVLTWYRPINRNLPKYLFESALNTKSIEVIELLLNLNCDVNLPNSTNGDPFYFCVFSTEFSSIKNMCLKSANYEVKNIKGQTILFHILFKYLQYADNTEMCEVLVKDFETIMSKHICLIYQRDQEGSTLVECIISLAPEYYNHGLKFLDIINTFIFKTIFEDKNANLFLQFIYNGYSLILLNTVFEMKIEESEEIFHLDVIEYIKENCDEELNKYSKIYLNSNFFNMLNNFYKLIKAGDLDKLKRMILTDNLCKNFVFFIDFAGRSCLHIAVLYDNFAIAKFLLDINKNLIHLKDNLNRTAFHYAYANGNRKMIELLVKSGIDTKVKDVRFLLAEEYLKNEIKNDEAFRVKNFKSIESSTNYGFASYLKCFEYKKLAKAIHDNDIRRINAIKEKLKIYRMRFSDFSLKTNEWVNGEPYIPLLKLSMELRSFSAFQCLLDDLLSNQSITSLELATDRIKTAKIRQKSAKTQTNLMLRNTLISIRDYAETHEIYEVTNILDNLGEDDEIKAALADEISFGNKARKPISINDKTLVNQKFITKYKDTSSNNFEFANDFHIKNIHQQNSITKFERLSYVNKSSSEYFKRSSQMCTII